MLWCTISGATSHHWQCVLLLTLYGDIHHGMSYLLMPYSDIHTRQLFPVYTTMTDDYGTVQECCGAPFPGPHPITGSVCYLLTLYGDIHHGMSYLLMPYSDIHTRQLFPVYTTMTDDYGTVQECCGAPLPGPHPIAGGGVLFAYTVW